MNLRLDVAYDGAPFRGYARQPDVRTVQQDLEDALELVLQVPISSVVAGRTDAGVHAVGQVVSVPGVPEVSDLTRLRDKLNKRCGPSIVVRSCSVAPDGFNARHDARSRTYVYALLLDEAPDPFLAGTTLHHPGDLDIEAMNEAAGHLVGNHDFSSFGRLPEPEADPVRSLFELRCAPDGNILRVTARANAFIQQMVRSLVGTLIAVGEGKHSPSDIATMLRAKDRAAAGPVAPPHGLCLVSVEYDTGWSGPAANG